MRIAAGLAVSASGRLEVERSEGVGSGADAQRYVYGKIYNAKAYNLCSHMPRLGPSGTLTPAQIKDLVGLLLDPASPVNE